MNTREYIESGVLELYIFGKLSKSENEEVQVYANEYPEIKQEIESIEKATGKRIGRSHDETEIQLAGLYGLGSIIPIIARSWLPVFPDEPKRYFA
jgi:hypothetical protein